MNVRIVETSPLDPAIQPLLEAHLKLMRASSPACSVHAMEASDLADADAVFVAAFLDDEVVGMGALKRLSDDLGELKSMHIVAAHRGLGLADKVLDHLLSKARAQGLTRISLETGSQPPFAAARAFYARRGFDVCPPFDAYVEDPESVFMTRALSD